MPAATDEPDGEGDDVADDEDGQHEYDDGHGRLASRAGITPVEPDEGEH